MKTFLQLISLVVVVWLLAGCENVDNLSIEEDATMFVEDEASYDANIYDDVEPDESPPDDLATDIHQDEWAPGCNPPWKDKTPLYCTPEGYFTFKCILTWDKPTCKATCTDPADPESTPFGGVTPESLTEEYHCSTVKP